jgi:hypothetical protein
VTVVRAVPWVTDEAGLAAGLMDEGQLDVELDGAPLSCYLQVYSHSEWQTYRRGDTLRAELWLDREGDVEDAARGASLRQLEGVRYEATGEIVRLLDDSSIVLDVGFPLRVDLHVTPHTSAQLPTLALSRAVVVRGTLTADPHVGEAASDRASGS